MTDILDVIASKCAPHAVLLNLLILPTAVYTWILWLRDRVDVPHIPFADLAALIALVDLALFLDPNALNSAGAGWNWPNIHERPIYLAGACISLFVSRILVVRFERVMAPIMIQQMDVWRAHGSERPRIPVSDRLNRNWRAYSWRQSASFSAITMLVSAHAVLWVAPNRWPSIFQIGDWTPGAVVVVITLIAFAAALSVSAGITLIGFTKFSLDSPHYTIRGEITDRPVP